MARPIEKPVTVTPDSDLMRLLDEADEGSPVLLERRGVVYRLSTVEAIEAPEVRTAEMEEMGEDIDYQPDPEAVRQMLDEVAGSWADIDTDKLIQDIYRWRREGSRNPDEIVP